MKFETESIDLADGWSIKCEKKKGNINDSRILWEPLSDGYRDSFIIGHLSPFNFLRCCIYLPYVDNTCNTI